MNQTKVQVPIDLSRNRWQIAVTLRSLPAYPLKVKIELQRKLCGFCERVIALPHENPTPQLFSYLAVIEI